MCVRLIIKISGGKSFFFKIKNQWVKSGAHFLPTDFSIHLAQSVWLKRRKKKRKKRKSIKQKLKMNVRVGMSLLGNITSICYMPFLQLCKLIILHQARLKKECLTGQQLNLTIFFCQYTHCVCTTHTFTHTHTLSHTLTQTHTLYMQSIHTCAFSHRLCVCHTLVHAHKLAWHTLFGKYILKCNKC